MFFKTLLLSSAPFHVFARSTLAQVMSVSIEGNLDIKTAWLREYLGLTQEGVAHVLKTFPAILSLSLDNLDGKASNCPDCSSWLFVRAACVLFHHMQHKSLRRR